MCDCCKDIVFALFKSTVNSLQSSAGFTTSKANVRLPPSGSTDKKKPFGYASSAGCKAPYSRAAQFRCAHLPPTGKLTGWDIQTVPQAHF